ncbi:Tax1-binding protein 1-like protein B [Frankliniella fusca]|uniref:Tax1-binding protein 1-like protein B n=1 Tax=Frankliniella fusca TaxID=407009 RepID=A0AAE1HZG6_9NEOP|nr:Tax1-binding protein 1-like protein B [Frankliniella fusca]
MDPDKEEEEGSGPSSLSSDQASLCVIPDPDDSSEEEGFIYLDKSSLPASLNVSEHDRAIIVFHSIDEDYPAHKDILCQYIRPDGWEESPKDNICLFKVGWVTKNDAVFVVPPGVPSSDPVGRIIISESLLPKDPTNLYQFCYMREYTLLGASTPFQFTLPVETSCYCDINDKSISEVTNGNKQDFSCDVDSILMVQQGAASHENLELSLSSERQDDSVLCHKNSLLGSLSLDSVRQSMSLYLSDCCSDKYEAFTLMECSGENQALESTETVKDSTQKLPDNEGISVNNVSLLYDHKECGKQDTIHSLTEEIHQLKQKVEEVGEERKWFQEQYNSLLETVRKYAEDLASERMAKEKLTGHLAELTKSYKMLCCDNTKLDNEILEGKQSFEEQSLKWKDEKRALERQVSSINSDIIKQKVEDLDGEKKWFQEQYNSLLETVKKYAEDLASERTAKEKLTGHLAELTKSHKMLCCDNTKLSTEILEVNQSFEAQSLKWEDEKRALERQCDEYKKQLDDLVARVSDYEVLTKCLEVELEEEMKLAKERDSYLVQVEQTKVHNLQMANNWLASTPSSTDNGNTLLEMEENVNSTLEALECALKEMDVLRSRKAAINKANRILREDFMQKKAEWEDRLTKQRIEFDAQLDELQTQLECEKSSKVTLLEESKALKHQLQQAQENDQQAVSEAMETAKKEIEMLRKQSAELEEECLLLRQNYGNQDIEDMNRTLLKNLQDAREEYKKLYTEKILTQEKLSRLKQKVKAKKTSRAQQESSPKADFIDAVSASWRYTIDELM